MATLITEPAVRFAPAGETAEEPRLEVGKRDPYQIALEANALALGLLPPEQASLRNQFERAITTVVLATAAGLARRSRPDKRNYYTVARASAAECTAIIHLVQRWGLAPPEDCQRARNAYLRVVQMLTNLALACV